MRSAIRDIFHYAALRAFRMQLSSHVRELRQHGSQICCLTYNTGTVHHCQWGDVEGFFAE